LLNIVF